jgi:hypothetical protein
MRNEERNVGQGASCCWRPSWPVFLFNLRRVLLSWLKNLNGLFFLNFDESGGFWVKIIKKFKKSIGAAHKTYST